MKRLLPALLVLALVPLARGGIIIVEEMEQSGGPMPGKSKMTFTAQGDETRVDIGDEVSSIVNAKTGTITSLMHNQKMAMRLPDGTFDAMKKSKAEDDIKPDIKPTGKKETINGFRCEEYAGKLKDMDVTFWVTQDVKGQKAILEQLGKASGGTDPFQGALADGKDFPGFPIRTIMKSPQLGTMSMTVLSIKNEDVPASTFQAPDDYKKVEMPKVPVSGQ